MSFCVSVHDFRVINKQLSLAMLPVILRLLNIDLLWVDVGSTSNKFARLNFKNSKKAQIVHPTIPHKPSKTLNKQFPPFSFWWLFLFFFFALASFFIAFLSLLRFPADFPFSHLRAELKRFASNILLTSSGTCYSVKHEQSMSVSMCLWVFAYAWWITLWFTSWNYVWECDSGDWGIPVLKYV